MVQRLSKDGPLRLDHAADEEVAIKGSGARDIARQQSLDITKRFHLVRAVG